MNHWPLTILHSLAALTKLIIPLVLVRIFPQEIIGEYKIFFLFVYLAPELLGIGGLMNGLGCWSGESERKGLLAASTVVVIIVTLLSFPLAFIASHAGWITFSDPWLLTAFAVYVALSLPRAFLEELLIVVGKVWASARYRFVAELLRAFTLVGVALVTQSLALALVSSALVSALEILLYIRVGLYARVWDFGAIHASHLKQVLRYAVPLSVAGVATVLFEKCDQFFLSQTLSTEEFALYSLGCLMIPPLIVLEQSVTRVLVPTLSAARRSEEPGKEQASLFRSAISQIAFWMIPSAFFLFLFADQIVLLLYTERYAASAQYFRLFALLYVLLSVPLDVVPRAHGMSKWLLRTYLVSGGLSVLLVASLGYSFGAFGALAALLLVQGVMRGYGLWYAGRLLKVPVRKLLPLMTVARILMSTLGAGVASFVLISTVHGTPLVMLLLGAALFSGSFITLWILFPYQRTFSAASTPAVLQVTQYLSVGGLERVVATLASELQDSGRWRSHVVSYDRVEGDHVETLGGELEARGVRVKEFHKKRGLCLRTVLAMSEYVRRERVQILHSHDLGSLIYAVLVKCICIETPVLIHTQHSFVHLSRNWRYAFYEKLFTRCADRIIGVSDAVEERYRELGLELERVKVISNGVQFPAQVDLSSERQVLVREQLLAESVFSEDECKTLQSTPYWICYVARIFPGKGQREALALFHALPKPIRAQCALLFVGPETSKDEQEALKQEVVGMPVFFSGATSTPHLWYEASTVCLSSSRFEGHPLVPIEALGCGALFVASDIEGHRSLSRDAILYDASRPEAGAQALMGVIAGRTKYPESWRGKREQCGVKYREQYSFAHTLQGYERIYRDYAPLPEEESTLLCQSIVQQEGTVL